MDTALWQKILQFDFDYPMSEYGFSTRLADENYWTKNYTDKAILDYKKFMYLAATNDVMVSPSEVVDLVWHQHLIFTPSYAAFCDLLGKKIQHIPSTHNRDDFQKFKQAKERTTKLYYENFGEQPMEIWGYNTMFDSLRLEKSRFKIRTFLIIGILSFIALIIPSYFLLQPLYIKIGNPYFLICYVSLVILTFISLEFFNKSQLKKITDRFDRNSFIFELQPMEMVYMKTQKMADVVNGVLNELILSKRIRANSDNTLEKLTYGDANTLEEFQIDKVYDDFGKLSYPTVVHQLARQPIFWNVANSLDAFKKYFNKSKKFGTLFYVNFVIQNILLMLGLIRLFTGILRDKPIIQISIVLVLMMALIIFYLHRLTKLTCTYTIPQLYKEKILPERNVSGDWQWSYFLLGSSVLMASFQPMAGRSTTKNTEGGNCGSSGESSGGSSCGSSCASSCGSCGGCGGD